METLRTKTETQNPEESTEPLSGFSQLLELNHVSVFRSELSSLSGACMHTPPASVQASTIQGVALQVYVVAGLGRRTDTRTSSFRFQPSKAR